MGSEGLEKDPLWFKNAVIYQLHVRGFYDLNDDGIGDFPGLTSKLDYLESLGITAIWLQPFYPSPLKDDGYDISNYLSVNPVYGHLKDFKRFLREAHKRGIRIITELVINHTSDQHPWFQRARLAKPGSSWRNFYVWSDTPNKYKEARIIFKDFETSNWSWDPIAKAYYWHRFYSHQPDLNFENPMVQKEVFRTLDFWLEMGVDGLRLDAIPYLFEQDGTSCENLQATHDFVKKLRKHVDAKFQDKVLIAEANQWPEDASAYFGEADECHMAFHFPVMPRLFMAIQMEDRFPIMDILEQTPILPLTCQWVMFLRNHDELTLEMVSDEERDYMYKIYAKDPTARINLGIRRRLAPLLENDRAKIELMNILLLSLPGTPVIYYGDEIGMGDNYYLGDRNGVRTPMQWSSDRNAGFSKANPQKLFLPLIIDPHYHYSVINVENQESNSSSLLWWVRRVLSVHKNHPAFGFGSLEFVISGNPKILAFTRIYNEEILLVITNLSRFPQAAELDLSKYASYVPHEIFHQNKFPVIKEEPYNITLGPYDYFWLSLVPSQAPVEIVKKDGPYLIAAGSSWKNIFKGKLLLKLEKDALPRFLEKARWFERKAATIQNSKIISIIPLDDSLLCLVQVGYYEIDEYDLYLLPISFALKPQSETILANRPQSVIALVKCDESEGILYDGLYSDEFRSMLLKQILHRKHAKINSDELYGYTGEVFRKSVLKKVEIPEISQVLEAEQSNSSIIYGQQYFLKLYRRLEEGIHPDIEMIKFLTDKANFTHVPSFVGGIEWRKPYSQPMAVAILEQIVPNEGTGWNYTLDALTRYYEQVLALKLPKEELSKIHDAEVSKTPSPPILQELIGASYLESARMLGERTAEMHLALASEPNDPNFSPEYCTGLYLRSLYQIMRSHVRAVYQLLKKKKSEIPESLKDVIDEIIKSEQEVLNFFQKLFKKKMEIARIRIHGDYHLGQVLHTGKDFSIIDFEGEPLISINSRRIKHLPLRDVAGMIRSFQYASQKVLLSDKLIKPEGMTSLEPWADIWYKKVSDIFLQSYLQKIQQSSVPLIAKDLADNEYLIQIFLLEKAYYELGYELNTRPEWVAIPCKGIIYNLKNKFVLTKPDNKAA